MAEKTDVFVVGAGPAGLATAIQLRHKGFAVVVADSVQPPIEKVCGEGLLPATILLLQRLGVQISSQDGFPFTGISFLDKRHSVEAQFPEGLGLGMRRPVLHQRLIEAAERAGAVLQWNRPVTGLAPEGVYCCRKLFHARWIIGADGTHSRVRKWIGVRPEKRRKWRYAFRRHYQAAPWSNYMQVHWGSKKQFYITPTSEREVCVVVISRDPALRVSTALEEFPQLAERLAGKDYLGEERGAVTTTESYPNVCRGNVFLVGDASGMVDAISGQGLYLAIRQAEALAHSLANQNPRLYQRAHRQISRHPAWMTRQILMMDSRPWMQRRILSILAREPTLFRSLVATHVGHGSSGWAAAASARIGWKLLSLWGS